MGDSVFAFDVDDCLEGGGQIRLPSTAGPVTFASIRAVAAQGDICGIVGNWVNLPGLLPDWREFLHFLLPPEPHGGSMPKAFWLAWIRQQYPGHAHYVMVGSDPRSHRTRPSYWNELYPGTLPVTHIAGDHLLSDDIGAAAQAGWEFIREDNWAAGQRTGNVPPPDPNKPYYHFPKHARLPMLYKTFTGAPEILKKDDAKGVVEAIVSVTGNKDLQGDIIDPGAWKAALDVGTMPRITADHRWNVQSNLGKTLEAEEWLPGDKRLPEAILSKGYGGLWVKGQFNLEKQLAREVYSDLTGGFVNEFSVGFDIARDEKGEKCECSEDDGFHIKSISPWYEWSVVFMGANPETVPLGFKAADAVKMYEHLFDKWSVLTQDDFEDWSDEHKLNAYYDTEHIPDEDLLPGAETGHRKDLILLAKWSRAFINKLPDSAFALILPGGSKDTSDRTVPRSLRKLPHHGLGGAVDKPHLANALSRAAQQSALKKAVPHLRKHANAIGMGKSIDDDHEVDNVPVNVPEETLQALGIEVGKSVAAAIAAHRTQRL